MWKLNLFSIGRVLTKNRMPQCLDLFSWVRRHIDLSDSCHAIMTVHGLLWTIVALHQWLNSNLPLNLPTKMIGNGRPVHSSFRLSKPIRIYWWYKQKKSTRTLQQPKPDILKTTVQLASLAVVRPGLHRLPGKIIAYFISMFLELTGEISILIHGSLGTQGLPYWPTPPIINIMFGSRRTNR